MRTERDPIEQVRLRFEENGWASEDDLKEIDKGIRLIVNEAAEFAQADPEPDPSELWTDIYA
jgi:pyruvate dehydrogenase E1 component alpha subunit